MLKKIILKIIHKLGYEVTNLKGSFSMFAAMERCLKRGLSANTIIDIGASNGNWTRKCSEYFPNANFLLVEALSDHENDLNRLKAQNARVDYIISAAAKEKGEVFFHNSSLFGGAASYLPFEQNCIKIPAISIDDEVKSRNLPGPYILKLDTHGFELPILEGAKNTLNNAALVIIEAYNYKISRESLLYFQLCEYMSNLGFNSIELTDFMLRKRDHSFWQMDIFFIRSDRKEFTNTSYE